MSLWRATEESVLDMLSDWRVPVDTVTIDTSGHQPGNLASRLEGRAVIINAATARLPRHSQGVRIDSTLDQVRNPQVAAGLAAACAPLPESTWRAAPLPENLRLTEVMIALDQVRAESRIHRHDPTLRLLLPTIATTMARAPLTGGDDAVAYQLLTLVCPRADALVLPTTCTAAAKAALASYLGAEALRRFVTTWRTLLATPDQRSALTAVARRWLDLADEYLPDRDDVTSEPELMADAAAETTTILEKVEAAAAQRLTALRDTLEVGDEITQRTTVLTADHGVVGAGTGLPAHRSLRHREPTSHDLHQRAALRSALSVARSRQIRTVARPSATPVGRANTRELIRMAAQRHHGTAVTATPWIRRIPELDDTPDITIATVLDVSASMASWTATAVPLMWAVACATHDLGGTATAWAFGGDHFEVIRAGTAPHLVPHLIDSGSGSTGYADAVEAACRDADITNRTGARLLVVLTDGRLTGEQEAQRLQSTVANAVDSGATVLWAITGSSHDAVVPDRTVLAQGVTPAGFATTIHDVLLSTVSSTRTGDTATAPQPKRRPLL